MDTNSYPPFRPFLVSAIVLFIIGATLFSLAIFTLEPGVWSRWLFFFGGTLTLIGLTLPATWFINLRFQSKPPAGAHVIIRQAAWVGVFGGLLAWLQWGERLVSLGIMAGLGLGLFVIEYLIRMREQSLWQPPKAGDETGSNDQSA